ncbi:hypothetical protein [Actinomadura hibisca]|uniref:hypothetical protein n=1 Tax=Actinomadura hibisca TaxID=68565 RepID=UPI000830512A|nr:hypothetical protein [Actinomadura hibisca]
MVLRNSEIKARLYALENFVGLTEGRGGMTLTARLDAQHDLLLALNQNHADTNRRLIGLEERTTSVEGRLTGVEGRLTGVEERLTGVEDVLGKVLWGMTEIKNLLREPGPPSGD